MKVLPNDINSYIAPSKKSNDDRVYHAEDAFSREPLAEVGYAAGGNPEVPCPVCNIYLDEKSKIENPACLAKKLSFGGENGVREKYYVRIEPRGLLFDPWGSSQMSLQNSKNKEWKFVEVNKRSFEFYRTFLQTRNKAWKLNAERELNNSYEGSARSEHKTTRKVRFIGGNNG